jgi:probable rRNA maturation factor
MPVAVRKAAADVVVTGRAPLPVATVRRAVRAVLAGERRGGTVSVTFLGLQRMRALNRAWLGHDRPTDVIAFSLGPPGADVIGDVYVCRAVAQREARAHGIALRQELVRLVVHGTLHVVGHDHPEGPARVRSAMWRRQERYVAGLAR